MGRSGYTVTQLFKDSLGYVGAGNCAGPFHVQYFYFSPRNIIYVLGSGTMQEKGLIFIVFCQLTFNRWSELITGEGDDPSVSTMQVGLLSPIPYPLFLLM